MNPKLIEELIVESRKAAQSGYPNGYCYRPEVEAAALKLIADAGMITMQAGTAHGVFVQPTDAAVKWLADANAQPHHTPAPAPAQPAAQPVAQSAAPQPGGVKIDDNIPMPATVTRNRFTAAEGGSLVDRWGFDRMIVGQSFFVAQAHSIRPDMPVHRSFSSVVSNANKKLYPKRFVIKQVDETATGNGVGARVWRVEDLTGPPPSRVSRKHATAPAPAPQGFAAPSDVAPAPAQGWQTPAPAYPAPPAPSAFPAPGGAPQPAPAPGYQIVHLADFAPPPGGFGGPPPFGS